MPVVLDAGRRDGDASAAVAIPLDVRAPSVARRVVAHCLADRGAPTSLEIAQLLASELVTNSVRHSGVPEGTAIVMRVHLFSGICRLEVEDPGHEGVIAPRPPDPRRSGGIGLNLLATLSESWGVIRAAAGPTRVWARLPCPPLA